MSALRHRIEALLFVADSPLTIEEIARYTGATQLEINAELYALRDECEQSRGIQLLPIAGGWQFSTRAEFAEMIAEFKQPQRNRLSRAQMEVLAIVAYQQPVTAAEVEAIRGVQSDYGLRALLDRRLIEEAGRKQTPGRPLLYRTTAQFLHAFGLESLASLPAITLPVESTVPT